jgi:transposase InsO family protein
LHTTDGRINNYGTRRIADKLKELYGLIVSRKRISAIMKDLNLKVNIKRRYKNTTDSNHNLPIAPNILNRDFISSLSCLSTFLTTQPACIQ